MSNRNTATLTTYVERARKVLQHEQRTHHQDQAIKPGGVEAFTARWHADASALCQTTGQDSGPVHRFAQHLSGYHEQDPIQRAASLRAALAILSELETAKPGTSTNTLAAPEKEYQSAKQQMPPKANTLATKERPKPRKVSADVEKSTGKTTSRSLTVKNVVTSGTTPVSEGTRTAGTKESIQDIPNPIRLEAGMSQGHTSLTLLSADITAIPGVGPTVATRMQTLGIRTVRDLLFYFPREHRDYSQLEKIANVPFGELTTTMGLIWDVELKRTGNGRTRTIATISDESGKLYVSWFNQPYLQKQLLAAKGDYLVVTGIKQRFGNKVEFSVRSHELPEQGDLLNTGRMVPISLN
ncbi:hypothetical protein KDW_26610 [Dictyobacter vulcani]|uniref:RecG wedge domain-containing protein n=1 Tax=Dictyobacter vulcani TaxID=2607529 RepID=A0A5J4KQV0_9CHLR|nr:hypothetical protein [Dictyobacter vulcani]GER88499.1 hypothetical protein KDW_26610 [Dictyobacter vulcani]